MRFISPFQFVALILCCSFIMLFGFSIPNIFRSTATPAVTRQMATSIFDFAVESIDGGDLVPLAQFKGKKAYLVVNVASK